MKSLSLNEKLTLSLKVELSLDKVLSGCEGVDLSKSELNQEELVQLVLDSLREKLVGQHQTDHPFLDSLEFTVSDVH